MILQNHMTSQSFIDFVTTTYLSAYKVPVVVMFVHILLMPTSLKKSQSLLTYSVGMIQHELFMFAKKTSSPYYLTKQLKWLSFFPPPGTHY